MKISLILIALVITACTDAKGTIKTLQNHGYTHIEIVGPGNSFTDGCWDDDDIVTEWRAVDKGGRMRTGTTCCSLFVCSIGRVK